MGDSRDERAVWHLYRIPLSVPQGRAACSGILTSALRFEYHMWTHSKACRKAARMETARRGAPPTSSVPNKGCQQAGPHPDHGQRVPQKFLQYPGKRSKFSKSMKKIEIVIQRYSSCEHSRHFHKMTLNRPRSCCRRARGSTGGCAIQGASAHSRTLLCSLSFVLVWI